MRERNALFVESLTVFNQWHGRNNSELIDELFEIFGIRSPEFLKDMNFKIDISLTWKQGI